MRAWIRAQPYAVVGGGLLLSLTVGLSILALPFVAQTDKLKVTDVLSVFLAAVAGIASFRAASGLTSHARRGWLWIGFGTLAWCGGEILWTYFEVVRGTEAPFPSLADVLYLGAYPMLLAGVLLLAISPRSTARLRTLLDAAVVLLLAAAPVWVYILAPIAADSEASVLEMVLGLSYPLGDLLLVFGLAVAALRRLREHSGLIMGSLAFGLSSFLVADLSFAALSQSDSFESGTPIDALWLAGYTFIGAAALLQMRWRTSHESEDAARLAAPWRQVIPLVLLLPLLVWSLAADATSEAIVQATLIGALSLVIIRSILGLSDVLLLNRELDDAATKLDDANKELGAKGRLLNKLLVEAVALSRRDSLTGLLNHASIIDELSLAMVDNPSGVVIAMLDVDNLKIINDSAGHQAGDDALREIAKTLESHEELTAGRYGGDEFLVFRVSHRSDLSVLENELDDALASLAELGIRVSQGIAAFPIDAEDVEELIARADQRLYRSKRARRQTAQNFAA